MAEKSKFKFSVVKSGVRESKATAPELFTNTIFNKFTINPLLSKLMGVQDGDYVVILDNASSKGENESMSFALVQGWVTGQDEKGEDVYMGAKLASAQHSKGSGLSLDFNYSGAFVNMLAVDNASGSVKIAELIEDGMVTKEKKKTGDVFVPQYRAYYKFVEKVGMEIEGEERDVFILEFDRREEITRE